MLSFLVVFRTLFRALRRGWHDPQFRGLLYLTLSLLLIGMIFYHRVEDWTFFQALYFSVVTLATVGYGDFSPHTVAGRAFTIFYILVGLGILVGFATQIATHIAASRAEARSGKKPGPGPTAPTPAG